MNLNSRLFDSIRVKRAPRQSGASTRIACDHPGCTLAGEFRAPMGRDREGQYFCFCLEHVREYNATYNYFNGMSDDAVAKYQREALVGHRPTWNMGVNRAGKGHREDGDDPSRRPPRHVPQPYDGRASRCPATQAKLQRRGHEGA